MRLATASLLIALSSLAAAQPTNAPAPITVTLNITVTDAKGTPVTDLTATELHIADNALTPNTTKFAHLIHPTPDPLVVLFDVLAFEVVQRLNLARWVDQALAQLPGDARVFIYLIDTDGKIQPVRPVSEAQQPYNANQVVEKFDNAVANLSPTRRRDLTDYPTMLFTTKQKALYALAQEMMKIKGHENILWLGNGMPSNYAEIGGWRDLTPDLYNMASRFNAVSISINGLYPQFSGPTDRNAEGMHILAEATGGQYDYSKDVTAVLNRVRADSLSTYLIQYQANPAPSNSQFHKVSVTCDRKGVHIFWQRAYLAAK